MPTTVIAGATGFVGTHIVPELLKSGEKVIALARDPGKVTQSFSGNVESISWNFHDPIKQLPECDTLIHLAGEPLFGKRWTTEQREVIRGSRVDSTKQLVAAISASTKKPSVFLCASAIGFYGDQGDKNLDETSPGAPSFLAGICAAWESEARLAESDGVRVVNMRTGMVLGANDGALSQLLPPFKMGLGGPVGTGDQWMSWIHIDDEVGLMFHAIKNESIKGPMNFTSPNPVTNREFATTLGRLMGRPSSFTTPAFALKLLLGDVSEVVLSSAKILPNVALTTGYVFKKPNLEEALASALRHS